MKHLFLSILISLVFSNAFATDCAQDYKEVKTSDIKKVLVKYGLSPKSVNISFQRVDLESCSYKNEVSFISALDKAIESFLFDDSDDESPMALSKHLLYDQVDYSYSSWYSVIFKTMASAEVGKLLNGGGVIHFKLNPKPTEGVDSYEDSWIFYLDQNDLISDHAFWAVIPRNGEEVYNYGFN